MLESPTVAEGQAGRIDQSDRPSERKRAELLRLDCEGLGLTVGITQGLVRLTGPDGRRRPFGFAYSDLRTRPPPEALARAYPDRKVKPEDLLEAARSIRPPRPQWTG